MYDLEIWRAAGSRNYAERGRTECRETVRGDSYKAAGRRGRRGRRLCTMLDVRCTIWEVRARCAVVVPVSQLEKFVRAAQIFLIRINDDIS